MLKIRYKLARFFCGFLPPIMSQQLRHLFIKLPEGADLNINFRQKSFTGSYFYGNTSDFHAFKFFIHGFFDWRNIIIAENVLSHLTGGIVEVGANIGTETISFSDVARKFGHKVIAFEPLPSNIKILENNLIKNRITNVLLVDCLVSDYVGEADFQVPAIKDSGSGFIAQNQNENTITAQVTTLDEFCSGYSTAIICMDVEGFEFQVLNGALSLINHQRPAIIVEVNKNYLEKRANISLSEFFEFFISNNYLCYYIGKLGLELVDIKNFKVRSNKNWLCIPEEHSHLEKKISFSLFVNGINPLFKYFHFK